MRRTGVSAANDLVRDFDGVRDWAGVIAYEVRLRSGGEEEHDAGGNPRRPQRHVDGYGEEAGYVPVRADGGLWPVKEKEVDVHDVHDAHDAQVPHDAEVPDGAALAASRAAAVDCPSISIAVAADDCGLASFGIGVLVAGVSEDRVLLASLYG